MKETKKISLLNKVSLFLFISFLFLAVLSHFVAYFPLDLYLSKLIQSINLPGFTEVMRFISYIGNSLVLPFVILLMGSVMIVSKLKTETLFWLVSVISALITDTLIKIIVNRPRPLDGIVTIYKHLSDKSFPSGHTVTYTVMFGLLIYFINIKIKNQYIKLSLLALLSIPVLLVGISRIYLGEHWASDVLGGYILGFLLLNISIYYYQRFKFHNPK